MTANDLARKAGRGLMATNAGQRVYRLLNTGTQRILNGRVWSGPARGLKFRGGDTAGYVLGVSEPAVQRALVEHLRPGAVFYDVGANIGFMAVLARRLVGPTGEVHCFEPVPETVRELRANLAANRFDAAIHEVALSDREGTAAMLAPLEMLGRSHFTPGGLPPEANIHQARTVPLDSLGLPAPSLIKIDVEGAESLVLRGMRRTLAAHRPVLVIEVHPGQGETVAALLEESGYEWRVLSDDGMPHYLATAR